MVSNYTLMKIAALGGIVTGFTGYVFRFHVISNIAKSETYKDAINALYIHKKAVPYLGEPITLGRIKYGSMRPENEEMYNWYEISITGTNTKGTLYYEVKLNSELENKSEVSKIEIKFDNLPGKTFVIRDNEIK